MDSQDIVWIVVAVVVVLALVALARMLMTRKRERDLAARREHATELRTEASQHAQELPDTGLRAQEERLKAERLRLEADRAQQRAQEAETGYQQQAALHEDRLREADQIDPDAGVARE
jgi:flagellar biosynthesis/type III secretory pathway M-ring protein FliF/YscJ